MPERTALPISVVIPTYQRRERVGVALAALARQTVPPSDYEVIVAIDGSTDGTREMIERLDVPYALASTWSENRGRAAACNAGIAVARGKLLVLLDDDMAPEPSFLGAHLRAHARDTRLGVLGAVPILVDPDSPPLRRYIGTKFNRHLDKIGRDDYTLDLRDFYSGNFSLATDVMREVGAFDEAFRAYGNEDLELFLRLSRAGVRFRFEPDAMAQQDFDKNFEQLARDNIAKGRTAVLLASKHPEAFGRLKLGTYNEGPLPLRLVRNALLLSSRVWPELPDWIVRFTRWLERRGRANLTRYYVLALGYFYWLGASAALRENRAAGTGLRSLREPGAVTGR
ncbi:MAG: glycosyltransferase family 2 protein [Longimicrobiales bacterium]